MFAFAFGEPATAAGFKTQPDDFRVAELLPFEPEGDGPHFLFEIEKRDVNTLDAVSQVANTLGVSRRQIGYSGLKDRFAVTRQWLSVPADGVDAARLEHMSTAQWHVRQVARHRRKLRVASHRHNRFEITLRQVANTGQQRDEVDNRLDTISRLGVPNYFGPQRFGNDGANLRRALALFEKRQRRGRTQERFAVAAARAFLFNLIVSTRVADASWNRLIDGDAVMLNGSNSWFPVDRLGAGDEQRVLDQDLHPSGAMWGCGERITTGEAGAIEARAAEAVDQLAAGLEQRGLKQERRALRLSVRDLSWQWQDRNVQLVFVLTKGGFATAVLRELVSHPLLSFSAPESLIQAARQLASST